MHARILALAALALAADAASLRGGSNEEVAETRNVLRGQVEDLKRMAQEEEAMLEVQKVEESSEHRPPQQRMRVLSDLHLGGCWAAHEGTQQKLMKFLKEMADPANDNGPPITNLVLLGDTWDWWLVPVDKKVPEPAALFQEENSFGVNITKVISLIKDISKRMKVYVVRGNHDDIYSKELNDIAFGDAVEFMEDGLEVNGVWMEHGNIFDMYSTVPREDGEPKKEGFSYFVTRTQAMPDSMSCKKATAAGKEGKFHDAMAMALNNQVHHLESFDKPDFAANPEIFAPKYLESLLMTQFGNNWRDVPVTSMNDDGYSTEYNSKKKVYTLGDAVRDHADDGKKMIKKYGEKHTLARLLATGMDNARMYSKMNNKHMVFISGHTHFPYAERVTRNKESKLGSELVYANSGAWTFDNYGRHLSSYVDVTFDKVGNEIPGMEEGSWRPSVVKYFEYPEKEARSSVSVPVPKSADFFGWEKDMHPDKLEMTIGSGAEGIKLGDLE